MESLLTHKQQTLVIQETEKYIDLAGDIFQQTYPMIAVQFDLTGHTIGMYKKYRNSRVIRYNAAIFLKYFSDNLSATVPHEVAHYIVDVNSRRKKVRPHGLEWQAIMAGFGADASRTAQYDLTDIPKRNYTTLPYRCDCQVHQLGIRRHNKIAKQHSQYFCRLCGEQLVAV
ncbi:MAG: metallopeptidase [Piscirickettsiaceae bacterium]|nr:MAG: metallopeptidase [Piscirickettsiaceae bacterium]